MCSCRAVVISSSNRLFSYSRAINKSYSWKHLIDLLDVESMIQSFSKCLQSLKPKYDDDVVDRCNYLLTNIMLIICAITVAAKQYVGEPLQCWVPAEFQNSWEQYIENFCFIESTYFLPFADDIPTDATIRDQHQIQYYQWIPFILILQALLFLIPRAIWTMFNWRTGAQFLPLRIGIELIDNDIDSLRFSC
ncbi:Innexin [Dirofilaria immitis]|nr:Innexin [Dirofilaria immitis]